MSLSTKKLVFGYCLISIWRKSNLLLSSPHIKGEPGRGDGRGNLPLEELEERLFAKIASLLFLSLLVPLLSISGKEEGKGGGGGTFLRNWGEGMKWSGGKKNS